jgi:hypothetical protein
MSGEIVLDPVVKIRIRADPNPDQDPKPPVDSRPQHSSILDVELRLARLAEANSLDFYYGFRYLQ